MEYCVRLRSTGKHEKQRIFIESTKKRKIIRAGRRGGKTTGAARIAVEGFLHGHRILYAAPTADQLQRFWYEVVRSLEEPIQYRVYVKNESSHFIELPGTQQRIRAKTAWNADTLRGDYADLLILDEFQLMDETAWSDVGAPMLMDNNGDAVFIYTPPSLRSRSTSKARDPLHASKMFAKAVKDPRWLALHFTSLDNPFLSKEGVEEVAKDMSRLSYRQEILAEDMVDIPGALWTTTLIEKYRITASQRPELVRIVVGVDPQADSSAHADERAETGIITGGKGTDGHIYVFRDDTTSGTPAIWGKASVGVYLDESADKLVGEVNNGGEMVENTIKTIRNEKDERIGLEVQFKKVRASRGKITRAEPVSALYEQGLVHHVGYFPELEEQMCTYVPGRKSPDRMDALVWMISELQWGREYHFGHLDPNHKTKTKVEDTNGSVKQ